MGYWRYLKRAMSSGAEENEHEEKRWLKNALFAYST
jgi:hypothetical protein